MRHTSMSIREDLRIPLTMLSLSFLEKLPYKGSYKGKRFLFEKSVSENGDKLLKLYLWDDLYNFENTNKEEMLIKDFAFDKDGIESGIDFIEQNIK